MQPKFFGRLTSQLVLGVLAASSSGRPAGATTTTLWQSSSPQTSGQAQPGQQKSCPPPSSQSSSPPSSQPGTTASKNCPADPNAGNKPTPLFSGSLTIKKSQQTSDNTALGFNGVDSNGQVQQAFLSAAPSSDSTQKTQAMDKYRPSPADIAAFEKDGGLPSAAPAQTPQK